MHLAGPCYAADRAAIASAGQTGCVEISEGCPSGLALDQEEDLCVESCPANRPFTVETSAPYCAASCPPNLAADGMNCVVDCSDPELVLVLYTELSYLSCVPPNASMVHVQLTFNLDFSDYNPNDNTNEFALRLVQTSTESVGEPTYRIAVQSIIAGSIIADLLVYQFPGEDPPVPEEIARRLRGLAINHDPALTDLDSIYNQVIAAVVTLPTTTGTTTTATTATTAQPVLEAAPPLPPGDPDLAAAAVVGASVAPLGLGAMAAWWWWRNNGTFFGKSNSFLKDKMSKKIHSDEEPLKGGPNQMTNPFIDPISRPDGPRPFLPPPLSGDDITPVSAPVLPSTPGGDPPMPGLGKRRPGGTMKTTEIDAAEMGDITCICGATFFDDHIQICGNCGRERPQICSCGNPFAEDSNVCTSCGAFRPNASKLRDIADGPFNVPPLRAPPHQYDPLADIADAGGETRPPSSEDGDGKCLPPGDHGFDLDDGGLGKTAPQPESEPSGHMTQGEIGPPAPPDVCPVMPNRDITQSEDDILKQACLPEYDDDDEYDEVPDDFDDLDSFDDLDDWEDDGLIAEVAAPPVRGHAPWMLEPWTPRLEEDAQSSPASSTGMGIARYQHLDGAAQLPGLIS